MRRNILIHGCCLGGLSLLVYSAWLAWPPLAFAAAGGLLTAFGMFAHHVTQPKGEK